MWKRRKALRSSGNFSYDCDLLDVYRCVVQLILLFYSNVSFECEFISENQPSKWSKQQPSSWFKLIAFYIITLDLIVSASKNRQQLFGYFTIFIATYLHIFITFQRVKLLLKCS